jgi:hypothetical protein
VQALNNQLKSICEAYNVIDLFVFGSRAKEIAAMAAELPRTKTQLQMLISQYALHKTPGFQLKILSNLRFHWKKRFK